MEPVELAFGKWVFPSQRLAKAAVEERLRRYKAGDYIGGEDRQFLLGLFAAYYPYFIEAFYGDQDPDLAEPPSFQMVDWTQYQLKGVTRGLRAIREDGSWRPVSWRRCIDKVNHASWVCAAARNEVTSQHRAVLSARIKRVGNVSDLSGLTTERLVVDYSLEQSLYSLVVKWLESEGMTFDEVVLDRKSVEFAHFDVADSWKDYHRIHASVRIVTQFERSPYEA